MAAELSTIELESILREKARAQRESFLQSALLHDVTRKGLIGENEFRKLVEQLAFTLTKEQFDSILRKIDHRRGQVRYQDFLDKFGAPSPRAVESRAISRSDVIVTPAFARSSIRTESIENLLQQKVRNNPKLILNAFRLVDYNRDGNILRRDFRKILEKNCGFRLEDESFDRLWQKYDFLSKGTINYHDFCRRNGIQESDHNEGTKSSMSWHSEIVVHGASRPTSVMDSAPANKQKKFIITNQMNGLDSKNLDTIEHEFRAKVSENIDLVRKVLCAFDVHGDGLISIDDLRTVIDKFVLQMSRDNFLALMKRWNYKASGRVPFLKFLNKFDSPVAPVQNGQTVPIRPNHRFNPVRGADRSFSTGQLLKLIHEHVKNDFPSFKQAFLAIDKNRDGHVNRGDFLRILRDRFKIRVEDEQFNELMVYLDPDKTKRIDYHQFLDLFEIVERVSSHTWLVSKHRVNNPKPMVMAWDTVEALMREKIEKEWTKISTALLLLEDTDEHVITISRLRRVLEMHVLPISDAHFEDLVNRCSLYDEGSGRLNHAEFITLLGVNIASGDTMGLSTRIQQEHDKTVEAFEENQQQRQANIDTNAGVRMTFMSPEEVITRLKDRLRGASSNFRKAFRAMDRRKVGRVSTIEFRQILRQYGMTMTDDAFSELCRRLKLTPNGSMDYYEFIDQFFDSREGSSDGPTRFGNHRFNEIMGDEPLRPAELAVAIRKKLKENFTDLRGAFTKYDPTHSGYLTRDQFRTMLIGQNLPIGSAEDFDQLCQLLKFGQRLSYREFLERFQIRETDEGHKWLISDHRVNETKPETLITAEEANAVLGERIHTKFHDISHAFNTISNSGTATIGKYDFSKLLIQLNLLLSNVEFERLWRFYDPISSGIISFQRFVKTLGLSEQFGSGDFAGVSGQVLNANEHGLLTHRQKMDQSHEKMLVGRLQLNLTADQVITELKDKMREHYTDFYAAFRKHDHKKTGVISVADLRSMLNALNYALNDKEFYLLLSKLGFPINGHKLSYIDFLKAFQDSDQYKSPQATALGDALLPKLVAKTRAPAAVTIGSEPLEYSHLSPEDAETELRRLVAEQKQVIALALSAFDRTNSGLVNASDFRRVLDQFCFRMTDQQFLHFIKKVLVRGDSSVNYETFLQSFSAGEANKSTKDWLDNLEQNVRLNTPQPISAHELEDRIHALLKNKLYEVTRDFDELDYAKIGVVGKDDLQGLLNRYLGRVSERTFEELWHRQEVNEFNNISIRAFLDRYASKSYSPNGNSNRLPLVKAPSPKRSLSPIMEHDEKNQQPPAVFRSMQVGTPNGNNRGSISRMSLSLSRLSQISGGRRSQQSPLVDATDLENRIRDTVVRNWKNIQKQCKKMDPERNGDVDLWDLKDVLTRYQCPVTIEDCRKMATKYDLHSNGRFCYPEFLRHILFDHRRAHRDKMAITKQNYNRPEPAVQRVLDSLSDFVVQNWKELRRSFRSADKMNTGLVNANEFRWALKECGVNLSEDDFFQVVTFFDRSLTDTIPYNSFIRYYLHSQ